MGELCYCAHKGAGVWVCHACVRACVFVCLYMHEGASVRVFLSLPVHVCVHMWVCE